MLIPHGTKRKTPVYMHNGYSYLKNSEKRGYKYLRCRLHGHGRCKALGRITPDGYFSVSSEHVSRLIWRRWLSV